MSKIHNAWSVLSCQSPTLGGRHGLYCQGVVVGVAGGVNVGVCVGLLVSSYDHTPASTYGT